VISQSDRAEGIGSMQTNISAVWSFHGPTVLKASCPREINTFNYVGSRLENNTVKNSKAINYYRLGTSSKWWKAV